MTAPADDHAANLAQLFRSSVRPRRLAPMIESLCAAGLCTLRELDVSEAWEWFNNPPAGKPWVFTNTGTFEICLTDKGREILSKMQELPG